MLSELLSKLTPMEWVTVIISVLAFIVSYLSFQYSRKAFALSLFDKRYKVFYNFTILVSKLALEFNEKSLSDCLQQIKILLWEARYIFGGDVCNLLDDIKKHIAGSITYFIVADRMANRQQREDYEELHKYKVEHYDPIRSLLGILLGDDKSSNLNFYFNKYLYDKSFKKPLHQECSF